MGHEVTRVTPLVDNVRALRTSLVELARGVKLGISAFQTVEVGIQLVFCESVSYIGMGDHQTVDSYLRRYYKSWIAATQQIQVSNSFLITPALMFLKNLSGLLRLFIF